MSRLFEEMQEARRRGEMALPPEEPEPPREVTFASSVIPGFASCEVCWATVDGRDTDAHAAWHRRVSV